MTTTLCAATTLWCLFCLGAPAWSQTAGPAPLLTLDEATRLALEHSRVLKISELDVGKAVDDTAALKTRRLPNFDVRMLAGSLVAPLNFTFPAGALGTFPSTGPVPRVDTNIGTDPKFVGVLFAQVAQPLTQLNTIGWGVRALTVGEELAKEQVRARQQTIRNRVQKLYYGLLQAQSGQSANLEALALYREVDRLVADYVERQVVLPAEGLSVKTTLARQEQTGLVLRNTIASLKEQLNVVMGRSIATDFSVVAGPADTAFDVDLTAIETSALEQRPDVRQARLRVQQAEYDLKRTKAAALPEVSVAFDYFGFYSFPVLPTNVAAVGIIGTWEPWDWGRRKQEASSKARTVEQARLAVAETEDAVRIDIRDRARKVQEASGMLTVAGLEQQTAREKLRVASDRYRLEASLHRQVLEAQAALADADLHYEQALASFWSARADFDTAVGGGDR